MDNEPDQRRPPLVGIVGPCCAGKSTLLSALQALGYSARVIAQEHSYVPHMWQVLTRPTWLVYLDVTYLVAQQRRWMDWTPADLEEQHHRLRHAREHCHLYLPTDPLTPDQVLDQNLDFLRFHGCSPDLAVV
jgi:hypothetical protein